MDGDPKGGRKALRLGETKPGKGFVRHASEFGLEMAVARALLTFALLITGLASGADGPARARLTGDSARLDPRREMPRPAHGGEMRMAGPIWLELVVTKGSLNVYVTDRSGIPLDAKGGKATATVHTDGKGTRIELRPTGGNRLAGKGRLRLKRSSVIFITVDLRGEKPHRAVFWPLEEAAANAQR